MNPFEGPLKEQCNELLIINKFGTRFNWYPSSFVFCSGQFHSKWTTLYKPSTTVSAIDCLRTSLYIFYSKYLHAQQMHHHSFQQLCTKVVSFITMHLHVLQQFSYNAKKQHNGIYIKKKNQMIKRCVLNFHFLNSQWQPFQANTHFLYRSCQGWGSLISTFPSKTVWMI